MLKKLLFICLLVSYPCYAIEDGDWWLKEVFSIPVQKMTLNLENENRFNDRFFNYQRTSFKGGLNMPLNDSGLSIEPGIKYIIFENNDNPTVEYLLNLKYTKKDIFDTKWTWDFRNRWEFIDNHEKSDWEYQVRFKNKLSHPLKLKNSEGREWKYYISDEPFYNFTKNDVTENRFESGISVPIKKNVSFDLGFMWRTKKNSGNSWDDTYHIMTSIIYKFPK